MRYVFIVQGEGRGHLTQAISLASTLRRHGHEVVEVLVGRNPNRVLPPFFEEQIGCPVTTFDSPSFDYGKAGKRGKMMGTVVKNITPKKLLGWRRSMRTIARHVKSQQPDVVVNFYEMLAGMAFKLYGVRVPIVSIAHQFLIGHPEFPLRAHDSRQMALRLNNRVCSLGTVKTLALSFYELPDSKRKRIAVVPPLLRKEVFELKPHDGGYILGYLLNPGYAEELRAWHAMHPATTLHLFWDKKEAPETWEVEPGMTFHRIHDKKFLKQMEGCSGFATTAGFESVCEAIYLGKPALLVPVHLEQEINARDASLVGAGVVSTEFDLGKLVDFIPKYSADTEKFRRWVARAEALFVQHLTEL